MSLNGWPTRFWKTGFDGRTFLTEEEWLTYLRRKPERRVGFGKSGEERCSECGGPSTDGNPLQWAHRINFLSGVRYLALTPDFLDNRVRVVAAHRKGCNRNAEWKFDRVLKHLWESGIRELPAFLPAEVRETWREFGEQPNRD